MLLLEDVSNESRSIQILEDLPTLPELIELNSNDEEPRGQLEGDLEEDEVPEEEKEEDPAKDLKMGQQGIEDAGSSMSAWARVIVLTQVMSLRMSLIQTKIPFRIRLVCSSFLSLI